MNIDEIIKSWKWRIVKAGSNQQEIADEVGITRTHLNTCINGKAALSIKVFNATENAIKTRENKIEKTLKESEDD